MSVTGYTALRQDQTTQLSVRQGASLDITVPLMPCLNALRSSPISRIGTCVVLLIEVINTAWPRHLYRAI